MESDKELLDWLEKQHGGALINDDFGRWAFVSSGIQNLNLDDDGPFDLATTHFVESHSFKDTIREAIIYARDAECEKESLGD